METIELKAEVREKSNRVHHLRQAGWVPAVLYGQDTVATSLQIEAKALQKVLKETGMHQLIALQINNRKPVLTLVREIQRDTIKHHYLHVDFYTVKMDRKITAQIPLIITGTSPAVKDLGGILTHSLDEVEIECLPNDLLSAIEVNIDHLVALNDTITVADLKVSSTITILSDPDSMVVKIEPPRTAEEIEGAGIEPTAVAEPEVLTAKKKEEEAEA
jgi:large subunit ribosomal protein L25